MQHWNFNEDARTSPKTVDSASGRKCIKLVV